MDKIGLAFGEHIKTEKFSKRRNDDSFVRRGFRGYVLLLALFLCVGLLLFQLFNLQIVNGMYYRELANSNRTRTLVIYPPRGIILDRNNTPLVFNAPGFRKIENDTVTFLERDEALERLANGEKGISVDSLRHYPYQDSFAHVLGYVGQITGEQLKQPDFSGYGLSDVVGVSGLEEYYEKVLHGIPGKKLIEVDASGREIRTLGQTDPISGRDIMVTLSAPIQQAAYEAMADVQKGAVVVSTPDGEILAIVSKPSFDPNLFTLGANYEATVSAYKTSEGVLTDTKNQPLLDRAISGTYPPGSTFKLVTAASGLEQKVIGKDYIVEDKGVIRIGEYSFSNWYFTQYGGTDGTVDVIKAISRSNDIFFYKLADEIGVKKLSETAGKFGIGQKLGIDLNGEKTGVLPTEAWKKESVGEGWYTGDTFIYGIGQGYLLSTPLQVNSFTQVVANGGTLYRPHLLKSNKKEVIRETLLSAENQSLIREGMIQSCSPGGVAFPFFNFAVKNPKLEIDGKNILEASVATTSANMKDARHVVVACKTGTAQWGGEKDDPHAWITLFAPAYDPEIVVTVLAEASGEGSQVAGPIAKDIVEAWFSQEK